MDNYIEKQSDAIVNGISVHEENKKVIGTTEGTVIYQKTNEQGQEFPVTVVCMNHIDIGIDDFVNELEQPPDLYTLDSVSFSAWQPPNTCKYCSENPMLLIV